MERGVFKRINVSMIQQYTEQLVSLVGRFVSSSNSSSSNNNNMMMIDGTVPSYQFQSSDLNIVTVHFAESCDYNTTTIEYVSAATSSTGGNALPNNESSSSSMVVELVGSATLLDNNTISFQIFAVRDLSKDMDLALYDRMIQLQHTEKFRTIYFPHNRENSMIQ